MCSLNLLCVFVTIGQAFQYCFFFFVNRIQEKKFRLPSSQRGPFGILLFCNRVHSQTGQCSEGSKSGNNIRANSSFSVSSGQLCMHRPLLQSCSVSHEVGGRSMSVTEKNEKCLCSRNSIMISFCLRKCYKNFNYFD